MTPGSDHDLISRIAKLNAIGIALSSEKDMPRLLEMILTGAQIITGADGGTLYTVNDQNQLAFEIVRTASLKIGMGGPNGIPVTFEPIPLYNEDDSPIAHRDTLTGIPNRYMFIDRLEVAVAQAKRNNTKLAVMFVDLDRFKNRTE
jgi:hypothetical protein